MKKVIVSVVAFAFAGSVFAAPNIDEQSDYPSIVDFARDLATFAPVSNHKIHQKRDVLANTSSDYPGTVDLANDFSLIGDSDRPATVYRDRIGVGVDEDLNSSWEMLIK